MDAPEDNLNPMLFKDRVGQRLRSAREYAGLDLSDIAARTRIPLRHLVAIEASDYTKMPSSTYSIGFAKSYARAVGLDDSEIGRDLRVELGTMSPMDAAHVNNYEPVDPTRIAPRWLALTALVLAGLVVGGYLLWRHYQAADAVSPVIDQPQIVGPVDNAPAAGNVALPTTDSGSTTNVAASMGNSVIAPASGATGPVVLTATGDVWLRIYDANDKVLVEKVMKKGESYIVPADANNPQIRTGAAESLGVTVAGKTVAPLGSAQHMIKDVGISAAALLARPALPTPAPQTPSTGEKRP